MNFSEKVYSLLKKVPKGKVTTYSALARAAGSPRAARAVGTLMRKNPNPDKIPCYKVVLSDGRIGNYSGPGGVFRKQALLSKDGIAISPGGRIRILARTSSRFEYHFAVAKSL
ncbi:MAG: MGMT family protein [archaeon]